MTPGTRTMDNRKEVHKMKKRICMILALVLLTAMVQIPLTASAGVMMVEVTKGASIRSSPGYDGEKISMAAVGSQYLYLGTEGKWYCLQVDDAKTGYLPADSCRLVEAPGIPRGSAKEAFDTIIRALKQPGGLVEEIPETFSGKTVLAVYYDLDGKAEEVSAEKLAEQGGYREIPEAVLAAGMEDADWALLIYPTVTDAEDDPIRVNVFAADMKNAVFYAPYAAEERETRLEYDGSSAELGAVLSEIKDSVFREKWEKAALLANDEAYQTGLKLMQEGKYYSAYESFSESGLEEAEEMKQQCVQTWPATGELWHSSAHKSNRTELKITVNQDNDRATLVRVYQKNEPVSVMFIGGSGSATIRIPPGTYVIKDGSGTDWFGMKEAFGREGYYETMTFGDDDSEEVQLDSGYAYTITINTESNPNADSVGSEQSDWEDFAE